MVIYSKKLPTPLDDINDGHEFQRIVAEYFRGIKDFKNGLSIIDVEVEDFGVGPDDGCDILVKFHFADSIMRSRRCYIIECKCHNRTIGVNNINIGRIGGLISQYNADGYLLICKLDASAPLKRQFVQISENEKYDLKIWTGTQLWRLFVKNKVLLESFFPDYYREYFEQNHSEEVFKNKVVELKKRTEK